MTYLAFHLVFLLPPLLILLATGFPRPPRLWAYLLMPLIALVYTTPWDNYLVWQGVWGYPEGGSSCASATCPWRSTSSSSSSPSSPGPSSTGWRGRRPQGQAASPGWWGRDVASSGRPGGPPPGPGRAVPLPGAHPRLLRPRLRPAVGLRRRPPLGLAAGPPPRGGPPHPLPLVRRRLGHPGGDLVDLPGTPWALGPLGSPWRRWSSSSAPTWPWSRASSSPGTPRP